jgi:hypothetical protein
MTGALMHKPLRLRRNSHDLEPPVLELVEEDVLIYVTV